RSRWAPGEFHHPHHVVRVRRECSPRDQSPAIRSRRPAPGRGGCCRSRRIAVSAVAGHRAHEYRLRRAPYGPGGLRERPGQRGMADDMRICGLCGNRFALLIPPTAEAAPTDALCSECLTLPEAPREPGNGEELTA